jgi:hypothetical protein
MLGKILLVKGFHVIFTKFHGCVLHIRAPRLLQNVPELNRHACEPFCSCKCRFSWISPVLCIGLDHHWKPFRWSIRTGFIVHCWKTALPNLHSAPERTIYRRLLCSEIRTQLTPGTVHWRVEKKSLGSLGRIALRKGRNSHIQCSHDIHRQPATWKNIAVQHAGVNKIPSKFDTYSWHLKSTFGRVTDLNTSLRDPLRRRSALKS